MADRRRIEALMALKTLASAKLYAKLIAAIRRSLPKADASGWYEPKAYRASAERLARLAQAAQQAEAQIAARTMSQMMREFDDPVEPARPNVSDVREGVDPVEVWQRPFEEYRYQVSQGRSPEEAVELAVERAELIADLNLQRADDIASRETMERSGEPTKAEKAKKSKPKEPKKKVIGYRRLIHPELSTGGTCGLCVAASTRLYKVSDLRAIHARCQCTVVPVYRGQDVGNGINIDDIRRVYSVQVFNTYDLKKLNDDNAGSTDGRKLKYTRYQVNEHGELGPVLTRKGDRFKDSGAPDSRAITPTQARADRDAAVQKLAKMLSGKATEAQIKAQRRLISRLNNIASRDVA